MSKNQNKFPQIANTAENTVQGWLKTYQSFLMHFHSQITHQQHWKTAPEKHNTHKPTFLHVPDASSKMGSFLDFLLVSKLTKRLLVYSLHYFSSQTEKIAKKKKKKTAAKRSQTLFPRFPNFSTPEQLQTVEISWIFDFSTSMFTLRRLNGF